MVSQGISLTCSSLECLELNYPNEGSKLTLRFLTISPQKPRVKSISPLSPQAQPSSPTTPGIVIVNSQYMYFSYLYFHREMDKQIHNLKNHKRINTTYCSVDLFYLTIQNRDLSMSLYMCGFTASLLTTIWDSMVQMAHNLSYHSPISIVPIL